MDISKRSEEVQKQYDKEFGPKESLFDSLLHVYPAHNEKFDK